MKKINVSFDMDGTLLHREDIQSYCKQLLSKDNIEVYITTRRYAPFIGQLPVDKQPTEYWWTTIGDKNWTEVFNLADDFGIKRENINFLNMVNDKSEHLKEKGYLWHLDDDDLEIEAINENTSVVAIHCKKENWKELCNNLINDKVKF